MMNATVSGVITTDQHRHERAIDNGLRGLYSDICWVIWDQYL